MFRFDESDSRYLIAYEVEHEHSIAPYVELTRRWIARFERGDIFGVVLVNADHKHDEDGGHEHREDHERDVAFEEAFTQLLNDFRRDHKANAEMSTVGFVRIFPSGWINQEIAKNPAFMDEIRTNQDLTSRYMFGVAGYVCLTVDEARAWIDSQIAKFVPPTRVPTQEMSVTALSSGSRVGLFYGSTTGMTEIAAHEIAQVWVNHGMEPIRATNIGNVKDLSHLLEYDYLILGIPTWNVGKLQDDWEIAFAQLDRFDFTGKQIALFGLGDQYGYPNNYLDAVGILGKKLIERGARLAGYWNDNHYEFTESAAFADGKFMGLALDEIHQAEHTDRRINQWVAQIISEFALQEERA